MISLLLQWLLHLLLILLHNLLFHSLINNLNIHLVALQQLWVREESVRGRYEHRHKLLCLLKNFAAFELREIWFLRGLS